MGNASKPTEATQDGDAVTTDVSQPASDTKPDLQAMLAEAEAEAAEAEAAAATARAKARAMRLEQKEQEEPADEDAEDARRRSGFGRPSLPVVARIVASIVIVASLAASGWIAWQHHQASVEKEHAGEFIDVAKQGVVDMTSFDFHVVKDQLRHIIDKSSGSFKDDLTARADQIVKIAETSKAVAKGTVTVAGVDSMSKDEAVVLVVGSEEITNAVGNQQPRSFRFRVTVTRDGDQLKVSKLEMVL